MVRQNLSHAFPDKARDNSQFWQRNFTCSWYRWHWNLKTRRMSAQDMRRRVTTELNPELLREYLQRFQRVGTGCWRSTRATGNGLLHGVKLHLDIPIDPV